MVTWGTNTVHTIGQGTPAPAPATGFGFGSAAPSPGAPATTAFGAPSPAPGGLFGSSAPAPTGGLFGTTTPAPTGGLFGSRTPAPTTTGFGGFGSPAPATGGLFGTTPAPAAGGLFGSPAPATGGLFGNLGPPPAQQQQQQPQQPQIPAQAALQAHMNAVSQQEQQRVTAALQKIQMAYQGTEPATEHRSAHFTAVAYNAATPEMRQFQQLHGMGRDGMVHPIAPPKPAQISQKDWSTAVVRNPDYANNMPVPLIGAAALLARATGQQEQVNALTSKLDTLHETANAVQQHYQGVAARLEHLQHSYTKLRAQLLKLMQKVELARCLNQPLQPDEIASIHRLAELKAAVDQLQQLLGRQRAQTDQQSQDLLASGSTTSLGTTGQPTQEQRQQAAARSGGGAAGGVVVQVTNVPDQDQLKQVLMEHRAALTQLTVQVQRDARDVALVKQRVEETRTVPVPHRP